MVWLPVGEKTSIIIVFSRVDKILACDGRTGGRTDGQTSCVTGVFTNGSLGVPPPAAKHVDVDELQVSRHISSYLHIYHLPVTGHQLNEVNDLSVQ